MHRSRELLISQGHQASSSVASLTHSLKQEHKIPSEEQITSDGELIAKFIPPVKNIVLTQLRRTEASIHEKQEILPAKTFHEINRMFQVTDKELIEGFFKEHRPGFFRINIPNSPVYELEAVCAGFYKLYAPNLVPHTHAVYNEKKEYIGVFSEALSDFKSLVVDPLKKEDLNVDFIIPDKLSIEQVDEFDNQLQTLENDEDHLEKILKKLKWESALLEAQENENNSPEQAVHIAKKQKLNSFAKTVLYNRKENVKKKKLEVYAKAMELKLGEQELQNYRIVKGLSITLTTSYVFIEVDLHRNNFCKNGKRIDFDMSLWPLLYHYKADILVQLRKPTTETSLVSARDIANFPNLIDAKPIYWPTCHSEKTSTGSVDLLKQYIPTFTENAYPEDSNPIFKSLEKNPVFIYHKFKTLAKYILTTKTIFKSIVKQYLSVDRQFEAKPMSDYIVSQQMERIKLFDKELVKIPEFIIFFKNNVEKLVEELCGELNKQKIAFVKEEIIDTKNAILKSQEFNLDSKKIEESTFNVVTFFSYFAQASKNPEEKQITLDDLEEAKKGAISLMTHYLTLNRSHNALAQKIINFCNEIKVNAEDKESPQKKLLEMVELLKSELKQIPPPSGVYVVTSFFSWTDIMYSYLTQLIDKIESNPKLAALTTNKILKSPS